MENLLEFVRTGASWLGANAEMAAFAMAAAMLVLLIFPLRRASILSAAMLGAGALAYTQDMNHSGITLFLFAVAILLLLVEKSLLQTKLGSMERSLAATIRSVRELEAAHARRQGFIARKMLPQFIPQQTVNAPEEEEEVEPAKRPIIVEESATNVTDMPIVRRNGL